MTIPAPAILRRAVLALGLLALGAGSAHAAPGQGTPTSPDEPVVKPVFATAAPELAGIDVVEHLGAPLPQNGQFLDEQGHPVRFGDLFDGVRPRVLIFAYHSCPTLCSLVLDAAVRGLAAIPWSVGKEYDAIVVSIDPRDKPEAARAKRDSIVAKYARPADAALPAKGWHFVVGDEANVRRLADAVGFQYRFDERQQQYAHPAALYLTSPNGEIARYLYGISFQPSDLRLGLLEASKGHTISTIEKLILYCYHYDPQGKHYAIVASNVMRLGGAATVILLAGMLSLLWLRDKRSGSIRMPTSRTFVKSELIAARPESTQASMP